MNSFDIKRKKPQPTFGPEKQHPKVDFIFPEFHPYQQDPSPQVQPTPPVSANPKRSRQFPKKLILVPFTLCMLALGAFLGMRFIGLAHSISQTNQSAGSQVSDTIGALLGAKIPILQQLDQSDIATAIRGKSSVNVLLLGYGGDGHSGAYLTDSMMVVNLNFATNQVAMISVPRDIWTQIPTNGNSGSFWKVNAAYELGLDQKQYPNKLPQYTGPNGGGNLAMATVSKIIGMPIDYYVAVDFTGFQQIVDTLGGVDINVDNTFTDYSYPTSDELADGTWCDAPDNTPTNCRYKVVHFDAGPQHMDGQRALEYARSRHATGVEGSDFARAKRQQKLIAAIQAKVFSLGGVTKIFAILNDINGHFTTNLSLAGIKDLSSYIKGIDLNQALHMSIDDNSLLVSSYSQDGQWILQPTAGPDNWDAVHTYIYDKINGIDPLQNAPATNTKTKLQQVQVQ